MFGGQGAAGIFRQQDEIAFMAAETAGATGYAVKLGVRHGMCTRSTARGRPPVPARGAAEIIDIAVRCIENIPCSPSGTVLRPGALLRQQPDLGSRMRARFRQYFYTAAFVGGTLVLIFGGNQAPL